jgi:hypothetical protein
VKHWVRKVATDVKEFIKNKKIAYIDMVMYYVNVEDSVHYDALKTNDYKLYNTYISSWEQTEHSEENFKNLLRNWDVDKMEPLKLTLEFNLLTIVDGVHRLAIYKFLYNSERFPLKLLNISYPSHTLETIEKALISTTNTTHYNGWSNARMKYGYHSFNLHNINFQGQRNPKMRLDLMRQFYKFENKCVLDLGCNNGGMLFHLPEIRKGLGVDFDTNCIDAAEIIKTELKIYDHLEFMQQDLNNCDLSNLLTENKPDVVFLLSLGSWVKNWPQLYTTVLKNTPTIILETNNSHEGKAQLDHFTSANCQIQLISSQSLDDVTNNTGRQTYLIQTSN